MAQGSKVALVSLLKEYSIGEDTKGIYVGDDYPKTLAQRQEDIYGGNIVDLIDSTNERLEEYNYPYMPNVFASISYDQNIDESVNVTSIGVSNSSDYRVFVMSVEFQAKKSPYADLFTNMCLSLDQCYRPNPTRIRPQMNSDKFMTIDPHSSSNLPLVPSGNPFNPNNHFGPSNLQTLTITVVFRFVPAPGSAVITFDLIP